MERWNQTAQSHYDNQKSGLGLSTARGDTGGKSGPSLGARVSNAKGQPIPGGQIVEVQAIVLIFCFDDI